ncbi:MAG: universal stress protein [Chromatiaceae bacterium]|nr:MAG: universal stress protein [Chromatiaceae bacterium]
MSAASAPEQTPSPYRHLLLAVDFLPESEIAITRAVQMRDRFGARLSLVHVVEYVPSAAQYAGGAFIAEPLLPEHGMLEQELITAARRDLEALGERLGLAPADCLIEAGPTGRSIQHVARDLGVDLIVVGVHEHTWLGRLLGSTSNDLLRHEVCDLLAVRLS